MTWRVCQRSIREYSQIGAVVSLSLIVLGFSILIEPLLGGPQVHSTKYPEIIFVQAAQIGVDRERFPEGSRIVRLRTETHENAPVNLTEGFFVAADPEVSFDGQMVLFSGKQSSQERWQVWEMRVDGSAKRQITKCSENCTHPAYLPGEEIAFTVESEQGRGGPSYLATARMDGTQVQRITFAGGAWRLESVLRDGRILASAAWPLAEEVASEKNRLLYTLRPDGSALDVLRCDHQSSAMRGDATELNDGSIVYVKSARNGLVLGNLAEVRRGDIHETEMGQWAGSFRYPRELSDGRLIVSRKIQRGSGRSTKLELYALALRKNGVAAKVYGDSEFHSLQAMPIAPHAAPKKFWSTLNAESKTGYFIALDSYASGDETTGRISAHITGVRVWTLPAGAAKEEVLGAAQVENDGSFYVEVAANQPVRFELLDASGKTIRAEHSWIWSRPGEQRGCAGCHSDKAVAPENRWPMALKRFDTPTRLQKVQSAAGESHGP